MREWKEGQPGELREIGFLPFPVDDVMCPGETKALHLYEVMWERVHVQRGSSKEGICVGARSIYTHTIVFGWVVIFCELVAHSSTWLQGGSPGGAQRSTFLVVRLDPAAENAPPA